MGHCPHAGNSDGTWRVRGQMGGPHFGDGFCSRSRLGSLFPSILFNAQRAGFERLQQLMIQVGLWLVVQLALRYLSCFTVASTAPSVCVAVLLLQVRSDLDVLLSESLGGLPAGLQFGQTVPSSDPHLQVRLAGEVVLPATFPSTANPCARCHRITESQPGWD